MKVETREEMVSSITEQVTRLIKESKRGMVDIPQDQGPPFFTCKSIDKERQETVFKSICPYTGVEI